MTANGSIAVPRTSGSPGRARSGPLLASGFFIPLAASLFLASPAALAVDVRLCTSEGAIVVELDERNAPLHAANFARYAEAGFYSGTVLHRVVNGTMVQGGGYDLALERRRPGDPVRNESGNRQSNRRGTIAASRGEDPDSATSQFFFNLSDNPHLDATASAPGYTVFGQVSSGLEVLDRIAALPTRRVGDLEDVPVPLVELEAVTTLPRTALFGQSVEPDPATLESGLDAAIASGDATATLAAADALHRACIALDGAGRLAEAESAIALRRYDRARYGLEQYLARATALDPLLPRAQRLYASLPQPQTSNIDELIRHCQRPTAPAVPDGRTAELDSLRIIESEVMRYRQLGELYLNCVGRLLDGDSLNELETIDATDRYNAVVVEMTAVVSRFNSAAEAYRAAQGFPPVDEEIPPLAVE